MGRRRKVLKRRLYTYEQLDARRYKALGASRPGQAEAPSLYGNVKVACADGRMRPGLRIKYIGTHIEVTLAMVYRTNEGTLYEVRGVGQSRNKPSVRKAIELWRRYVPVFTPHDPAQRLYAGDRARYLLTGGVVVPLEDHEVPGIWLTMPRSMSPKREDWALGGGRSNFHTLPNFTRRCRLFATRLRKALAEDRMGEVQLRNHHDWPSNYWVNPGNSLHVCTPPSGTRNGRRLVVQIACHDRASREHFHVDGDYGIKHCQFFAIEDGKDRHAMLRWKSARDAILGIREWIIGDIYIPGPG